MNTTIDKVTYAKELQKLNAEFRRLKAYQVIEDSEYNFKIVLFEHCEINLAYCYAQHLPIKIIVENAIYKAYEAFIKSKDTFVTPRFKKIPKTIRNFGNSRNHSITKFKRFVEIQIAQKVPEFNLACRYYGIKPTFQDFIKVKEMPEFVFEMEPAYFYYLAEHKELLGENKSATYKKVHAELDNKHIIKAFQACKYMDGKALVNNITSVYQNQMINIQFIAGTPLFNSHLINRYTVGMPIDSVYVILDKNSFCHAYNMCAQHSRKHGQVKSAINKLDEIADWIRNEHPTFDNNQKKAGFKYLVRKSDEWHARILNEKAAKIKKEAWIPVIGELSSKHVQAKELTDSEALFQEGQTMKHCVGTYADYCKNYQSVIFHLEESKNIATAEFKIEDKKLKLAQIRGKYNAAIPTGSKLYKFTHQIIKQGNEALKTFTTAKSLSNPV